MRKDLSTHDFEVLKKLTLMPSAVGFEDEVQDFLINHYKSLGLSPSKDLKSEKKIYGVDKLNNLYAKFPGNKNLPSVAFMAHSDSPAFMTEILRENGMIHARPIGWKGSIDRRVWGATPLILKSKNSYVPGLFTTKSAHLVEYGEEDFTPDEEEILVDVGAKNLEELKKIGIQKGTPVFFKPHFSKLAGSRISATNLDDRVGTISIYSLANILSKKNYERGDVYLVSTVSEEADTQGAILASSILSKFVDVGVSLDSNIAVDTFYGDPEWEYAKYGTQNALGKGYTLGFNGFNKKLTGLAKLISEEENIPFQEEAFREPLSTDDYHFRNLGISHLYIGIPTRNLHSPVEVVDTKDIQSAINISENMIYGIANSKELKNHFDSIIKP